MKLIEFSELQNLPTIQSIQEAKELLDHRKMFLLARKEMATRTLVTGASAGIGLALVARFARDGHQVFGCARNITALQVS